MIDKQKTLEVLKEWFEAGMIMYENLPKLAEILSNQSESETKCPKCEGRLRFGSCVSNCPDCGWQGDEQGNSQPESEWISVEDEIVSELPIKRRFIGELYTRGLITSAQFNVCLDWIDKGQPLPSAPEDKRFLK